MTTIHSYTNDQRILDLPHKDLRRARAAALNIIPTTTGAAKAIGAGASPSSRASSTASPCACRRPTVSLVDLVGERWPSTPPSESVNAAFKKAAEGPLKGILEYTEEPLVSMDFKGDAALVDRSTPARPWCIGDTMVKVLAWYDNEWGYSVRLADLVEFMAQKL